MAIETANSLVESIRALGLFEPARMERLSQDLAERFAQPRDLGRELLQLEWLTAFQVNQLLQGKGQQLLLGPYVLLQRLGAGGMGEVFKARHVRLQRIAALKVIGRQRLGQGPAVERFRREAEAAAQLSHPNIVAVHDAGEEGDRHYLAMEYIDGIDLGRLIQETGPLPVALACDFIRQATLGLHAAHELGFVHRDIKPANLLVAPRGGMAGRQAGAICNLERFHGATIKILDMGLVRLQPERIEATEMALTQKGIVLGTMDYLAPEQARNSHRVDRRADLYALGCTLYHLLAGQPPFAGGLPLDKLLRHQTEEPPALGRTRPDAPAALQAIVARLLAKRPEDRPGGADELALALVEILNQHGETVAFEFSPPAPLHSRGANATRLATRSAKATQLVSLPARGGARQKTRHASPRLARWWWLAGVVVFGLVAGLAGQFLRPEPSREAPPPEPAMVHPLENHVPADSAAVLAVKPAELFRATIFHEREHPERILRGDPILPGLLDRLRIDLVRDVSWVRIHVPAHLPAQMQWLVRGPFLRRFQPDGKVLRAEAGSSPGQEKLFRYQPKGRPALFLAARESYLLASPSPGRVRSSLAEAAAKKHPPISSEVMRRLLGKVDRNQTFWLAATPQRLGDGRGLTSDPGSQSLLRAVLKHSSAIHGGVRCGRDLRVRFVLEGDEAGLRVIVKKLEALKKLSSAWLFRNVGAPHDQRLWFLMFAYTQLTLGSKTLEVTSQVSAERAE
jgi:serine/threonine protein kinase